MDLIEQLRFVHCRVDTSGRWLDADVAQPIMIKAAAEIERLRATLDELAGLMQEVIDGDYVPDSFTLQPAEHALGKSWEKP